MSHSSLYGIKKNYVGEVLCEYRNSWWFSPVIWDTLSDKYLPRDLYGYIQSVIGRHGKEVWMQINSIMNSSNNTTDRICWEMSNSQIFFTKDKECIVDNVHKFIEQNKGYGKYRGDILSFLEREHIIERFHQIADDILTLDENEYPYFVFKNTSVDDDVEYWFYEYNKELGEYIDKSLKDWSEFISEFVLIKDGKIDDFISNLDYQHE